MFYTIAEVKNQLPNIQAILPNGENINAWISGRENEFATVSIRHADDSIRTYEFAWSTLANCLNSDRPVRI